MTSALATCSTGQLAIQIYNFAGTAGEFHAYIRFTNNGVPCSMYKYPGLEPVLSNGRKDDVKLVRGPLSTSSVAHTVQRVTLKRHGIAWTDVFWEDQCTKYVRPAALLVTPPNDYTAKRVSVKPLHGGGLISICDDKLTISPVFSKLVNSGETSSL